jgi:hypothetical protein
LSDLLDQSGHAEQTSVTLDGTTYPHSIEYGDTQVGEGLEQNNGTISFLYDISQYHYSTFDATVGFLTGNSDPAAVGLFTVEVDGSAIKSVTCPRYGACAIRANLPVGDQLSLEMQLTKWTDPRQEEYFPAAYPVWGDAQLSNS